MTDNIGIDTILNPKTGVYRNDSKQQYEFWVFNSINPYGKLLGTCSYVIPERERTIWEQKIGEMILKEA